MHLHTQSGHSCETENGVCGLFEGKEKQPMQTDVPDVFMHTDCSVSAAEGLVQERSFTAS